MRTGHRVSVDSVRAVADAVWARLLQAQPYYAARAGVIPDGIPTLREEEVRTNAEAATALLARLRAIDPIPEDQDLAAIAEHVLEEEVMKAEYLWLEHV